MWTAAPQARPSPLLLLLNTCPRPCQVLPPCSSITPLVLHVAPFAQARFVLLPASLGLLHTPGCCCFSVGMVLHHLCNVRLREIHVLQHLLHQLVLGVAVQQPSFAQRGHVQRLHVQSCWPLVWPQRCTSPQFAMMQAADTNVCRQGVYTRAERGGHWWWSSGMGAQE